MWRVDVDALLHEELFVEAELADAGGREAYGEMVDVLLEELNGVMRDVIGYLRRSLLTSQLDSQRRYFEGLMAANNAERDGALSAKEAAESRARVIAGAVDAARDARAKLQEAHAKIDDGLAKNAKLEEERDFFKQLNDTLLENQRQLRANLDATEAKLNEANETNDAKIRDLQEQVRDLMVFIEAQSKLAEGTDGGDSIEGGDVVGVSDGDAAPSKHTFVVECDGHCYPARHTAVAGAITDPAVKRQVKRTTLHKR